MEILTVLSSLFGGVIKILLGRPKRRRRKLTAKLKNLCPHIWNLRFVKTDAGDDAIAYDSLFSSPAGTDLYICSRCGLKLREHALQVHEQELVASVPTNWEIAKPIVRNIQRRGERCQKIIKKLNRHGGPCPS